MCDTLDIIENRGIEKGKVSVIKAIMKNLGLSSEQGRSATA